MSAASDGQRKPRPGSESDPRLHVPDAAGPKDGGRAPGGEQGATCRFVLHVSRFDEDAAEAAAEAVKRWADECHVDLRGTLGTCSKSTPDGMPGQPGLSGFARFLGG